jgi:hypothetical protein
MDTYLMMEQAMASDNDLTIMHEPTFYHHLDGQAPLLVDPVLQQKLDNIRENHLVCWRFYDTWHLRHPKGILAGMVAQFGSGPRTRARETDCRHRFERGR